MSTHARAAAGELDTTFGSAGLASAALGSPAIGRTDVLVQPDGKIVVATVVSAALRIARYDAAGVLDASFGDGGDAGGIVLPAAQQTDLRHVALALQNDGKIVVAFDRGGASPPNWGLARLERDGRLDPFFAEHGRVASPPVDEDRRPMLTDVAVQPDGRIVVGFVLDSDLLATTPNLLGALARYDAHGALDPSFGSNGVVVASDVGNLEDIPEAIAIQPDGKIVVAGTHRVTAGSFERFVSRYQVNGAVDSGFGVGGTTIVPDGSVAALAIDAAGNLIVAGSSASGATVFRLDPMGGLDGGFGTAGSTTVAGLIGSVLSLAVESDGKLVITGNPSSGGLVVGRLTASGPADPSFGIAGLVETALPEPDHGSNMATVALQADGKIVATALGGSAVVVARYDGDTSSSCGNGVVEPSERCDDGGLVPGDGCDASCNVEPCFICTVAGPGGCSANPLDTDADGVCDDLDDCALAADATQDDADGDARGDACDSCPLVSDTTLADGDRDGTGDVCDACTSPSGLRAASLVIKDVLQPGDDDQVKLRGTTSLVSPSAPGIDPAMNGVRLQIRDANGTTVLDTTIPGGAFDRPTRTGWKTPRPGRWTYQGPNGTLPISRVALARNARRPAEIAFTLTGRRSDLLSAAPPLPLVLTLTLDPPLASRDRCVEVAFPADRCAVAAASGSLSCSCRANASGACL